MGGAWDGGARRRAVWDVAMRGGLRARLLCGVLISAAAVVGVQAIAAAQQGVAPELVERARTQMGQIERVESERAAPGARAERGRSRVAHRDRSDAAAADLAVPQLSGFFGSVPSGEQRAAAAGVRRYLDERTALVDEPGPVDGLLESLSALIAGRGGAPVDLTLGSVAEGFAAANPLVAVTLPSGSSLFVRTIGDPAPGQRLPVGSRGVVGRYFATPAPVDVDLVHT